MNFELKNITNPILNSYSQLFFSKNNWFAVLLALSTFIKWEIGVAGFICLISAIGIAKLLGYSEHYIQDGTYTFNSLMSGMSLAIFFEFTPSFVFLLVLAGIISFFITLWILNWTTRRGIPVLSWTFILVTWLALLGASNFTSFEFVSNDSVQLSDSPLAGIVGDIDGWLNRLGFPDLVKVYLRSLGAIMFQYNTLAGVFIFIGLCIYSRMATLLSLLGFFVGYLFYDYFEGDFTQLIFSYIGFNFILTAIALGGFFIVPNWKSFLLIAAIIPLMAILISALSKFFSPFGLPLFSLPFCVMVTLLLIGLQLRVDPKNLLLVTNQQFSPEENHYKTHLHTKRFGKQSFYQLALPVMGEWTISQGYNGEITHISEWQHALDFVITDSDGKTYREPGYELPDYYCYELPIIAPAAGYVVKVVDDVEENPVGGVNINQNWGNTVIIKHGEGFFSKLSHLKTGTINVKEGDYIHKGDIIGKQGNSGRSPEPHLHFQVQTTPFIGSKTIPYPFSYYLSEENGQWNFKEFDTPKENETIKNIESSTLFAKAFGFIPGQTLRWKKGDEILEWDIHTDAYNLTYIHCNKTNSSIYFVNNQTVFYCTDFFGDHSSDLFQFYLGAQKILLGAYSNIELHDFININHLTSRGLKALHDVTAPFFHFLKANYKSEIKSIDNEKAAENAIIQSHCELTSFGKSKKQIDFEIELKNDKLFTFTYTKKGQKVILECID